ncbi:MAG: hypothetical protein P4L31_07635 [Candidatus Babeliales bacterium]|nr:hypothetical protein [Candidatus Babeliales bacterium]
MSLPLEYYFDKRGIEIRIGDILKVYHFGGGRRRVYYLWKLVSFDEKMGLIGIHTGSSKEANGSFRIHAIADERGVCTYAEIINRDCGFDNKYAAQINPVNTIRKRIDISLFKTL